MRGPITTRPIPNTLLLSASVSVLGELKLSENNTYNPSTSFSSYYITKEEFPRFENYLRKVTIFNSIEDKEIERMDIPLNWPPTRFKISRKLP